MRGQWRYDGDEIYIPSCHGQSEYRVFIFLQLIVCEAKSEELVHYPTMLLAPVNGSVPQIWGKPQKSHKFKKAKGVWSIVVSACCADCRGFD